jgi:MFS family permease
MPVTSDDEELELDPLHRSAGMEEEGSEAGPSGQHLNGDDLDDEGPLSSRHGAEQTFGSALDRRTKRKLDWILLPFLVILFLLNSLDKSNVGNAETAGFTRDTGLQPDDLNDSMAFFFAFFVGLQPVGAAFGRKFGMRRFVPACMTLWGVCTLLHMWITAKWQLILLRIAIATLEAGFYPTTVSYLSLFYTRFEFAVRLGIFYGQLALSGVLGGVMSWAIFRRFEHSPPMPPATQAQSDGGWKSWEVLFLVEGCMTMTIAAIGFFWLPHNAESAWFLNAEEKKWAEQRMRLDRAEAAGIAPRDKPRSKASRASDDFEGDEGEAHDRLLPESGSTQRTMRAASGAPVTADAGLTRHDILSAFLDYKIWHILAVNILSAIPATSFGVFLPIVVKQLSPALNISPSASNLLSAPPFAFGAVVLFSFTRWSDRSKRRFVPILWGLGLLLVGLTLTVLIPMNRYGLRYAALCVLLSGSFVASPLTVAWLSNNTPEPGKRTILIGINGWGNLAGIFLALLFTQEDRKTGYIRPFIVMLMCVLASFAGYIALWVILGRENKRRDAIIANWSEEDKEREELLGDVPVPLTVSQRLWRDVGLGALARGFGLEEGRKGDDKMTYRYGL